MSAPANKGAFAIFAPQFMLIPFHISWLKYTEQQRLGVATVEYKTLHIFGIRIARWRCD